MSFNTPVFRQVFAEFDDPARYPAAAIEAYATVAEAQMSAERWGDSYDYGVQLFVAHHIVRSAQSRAAALRGQQAGNVQGVLTSKSVDGVSASYAVDKVQYEGAGYWNTTTYGIEWWRISQLVGAGCLQL